MKLYITSTSPFARKVRIAVDVLNLHTQVEAVSTNPFDDKDFRKINPLGKIPALLDDDFFLFDSDLICEYLNEFAHELDAEKETPADIDIIKDPLCKRFYSRKLNLLANGILDAAVSTVFEARRKDAEQSEFWMKRWDEAIHSALGHLDTIVDGAFAGSDAAPSLKEISLACALGYLDFRREDLAWRETYKSLAAWFDPIEQCSWFTSTAPE